MEKIEPPESDEMLHRHQYYSIVSAVINNGLQDINGIGKKVTQLSESHVEVRDEVKHLVVTVRSTSESLRGAEDKIDEITKLQSRMRDDFIRAKTTAKNILTGVTVLWTLVGGGLGWYITDSISEYRLNISRIEAIEKKNIATDAETRSTREEVSRQLQDHQKQLSDLRAVIDLLKSK